MVLSAMKNIKAGKILDNYDAIYESILLDIKSIQMNKDRLFYEIRKCEYLNNRYERLLCEDNPAFSVLLGVSSFVFAGVVLFQDAMDSNQITQMFEINFALVLVVIGPHLISSLLLDKEKIIKKSNENNIKLNVLKDILVKEYEITI